MIVVSFVCSCERITEEIILYTFSSSLNFEEIKKWAPSDLLFLKDIQENILDKHLDVDKFIEFGIHDDLQYYEINFDESSRNYSLEYIIEKHINELASDEHKERIRGAIEAGVLAENIEALEKCYRIDAIRNGRDTNDKL